MNVVISDSVRQAGLEDAVRKVSERFPKVIARSLRPLVQVTWEVLTDAQGGKWVMITLEYDGRATEREVFDPGALSNVEFLRERFEWLWGRVLRTRLIQQVDELPEEAAGLVLQSENE